VLDELRRIQLLESLKELLDSEVITFALFQQLRGVESERSFLREVALFFWHLFPGAAGLQSPSLQRRVRKLLVATSSPCGAPSCPSWWHLSVPLFRVSPTNQLMKVECRDIQKIDHVAYETYPCGRCINANHLLAFGLIVARQAQGEVTGRSEWTKRKGSNRTSLESYG
jgi:hypothetical protein